MIPTEQDLRIVEAYSQLRSQRDAFGKVALQFELTVGRVRHRYFKTEKWFESMFRKDV